MKVIHIHAKSDIDARLTANALKSLPKKKYGVVTTIQHLDNIEPVVKQVKGKLAGQVLGCNAINAELFAKDVDAFLFVGTGVFHALNVAWKTKKPVWIWNPVSRLLTRVEDAEVQRYGRRINALYKKFLLADNVGVIVSLKPGQVDFSRAREFAERKDKNYYLFVADEINLSELENFPFIDFWINSACPRIPDLVGNVMNIDDLAGFIGQSFVRAAGRTIWLAKP